VVMPGKAWRRRGAGACDGGFAAAGLGNDEVGGDAAVGRATDSKFVGISNALRDRVVHHSLIVLIVLVSPVGIDRCTEFLPVTGRSPRIGKQDGVAVGGIELGQMIERWSVLTHGAAMGVQQGRDFLAVNVVERFVEF